MKIKRYAQGKEYTYDRKQIMVTSETHKKIKENMTKHGFTTMTQYLTHLVNEG